MSRAAFFNPIGCNSRSPSAKRFDADTFSQSVVLLGCLVLLQRGIGFLRSFYVCSSLSPVELGQWDLAFNFLTIVAPLAVFGIPGSFGRYVPQYELNGQQRRFLRHTLLACLCLTMSGSLLIYLFRTSFARYFFGGRDHAPLVTVLAVGLPLVICFNYATSWFTGKRLSRFVFRIQFLQTLFFFGFSVLALQLFLPSAKVVIISYFLSCFAAIALAGRYALLETGVEPAHTMPAADCSIWVKILPFAFWVWVSNALINLFAVCDRVLLVNFYADKEVPIEFVVGQYHTACIFPALLMTLGATVGSMMTPYLSKDWESGCRDSVTARINLMLKAIGLLCLAASVAILFAAPLLFSKIWNDKFAMGESLLPMTLCYCSCAAMSLIAQKYFWCIEKTWFSTSALLAGLTCNFLLGLTLIGPFGIKGVVASTLASHALVLVSVLLLCQRFGLKLDFGVFAIGTALSAICFGKWIACFCLAILVLATVYTEVCFSDSWKRAMKLKLRSLRPARLGGLS